MDTKTPEETVSFKTFDAEDLVHSATVNPIYFFSVGEKIVAFANL